MTFIKNNIYIFYFGSIEFWIKLENNQIRCLYKVVSILLSVKDIFV